MITLAQFLNPKYPNRNAWIKEGGFEIYLRKSPRTKEGNLNYNGEPWLDLANMNANPPGQGMLTRFLVELEPNYNLFVENVLNERLASYFDRRGYARYDPPGISQYLAGELPCFIRLKGIR